MPLDAQSDPQRCDLISNEWEPCTPAMLEQNDQTIYALLTDPAYGFPTVLPNGNYASTSGGGEEPPPLVEICLDDHSGLSQHFHVALEIYDNGAPLTIPADIGIDTEACPGGMHIIHTHDGSGRLHIETPEPGPILLGTFFSIWGQSFSAQQVLHMVADGNSTLTLEVNDVLVDTWGETQLADEQLIVVEYQLAGGGETDDPPDDTDDSPANDTGNPPANNTSKQSDDTDGISGLPASSLLASAAVVSIIALRCRRSD